MSPDRATSVQPDERRSPAGPTPKASCESGRGRAAAASTRRGQGAEVGKRVEKGQHPRRHRGKQAAPLTPSSRARSSEGPAPHVAPRKAGGPSGCVAGRWLL